jgi:hypothetical protein
VGEADDEVDQPSLAIRVAGVDVDIAVDRPLDISVEGRLTAGATSSRTRRPSAVMVSTAW